MRNTLLLLILFCLFGCQKTISFKNIDNGIDSDIVKYDLLTYKVLNTIKKDEFYKIAIADIESGNPTQAQKELANIYRQILNDKDFKNDEIYTVIDFTSEINGFLYHEIGYFDQDIIVEYKIELEPTKRKF